MVHEPLSVDRAMELAFGNYDRKRGRSMHWIDAPEKTDGWGLRSGWVCAQKILFMPVVEQGRVRYLLATLSCSEEATGFCHACSPILSLASFRETKAGWKIEARNRKPIRSEGDEGVGGPLVPVRVGANRVGLWDQGCGIAQGYVGGIANLYVFIGKEAREIFSGRTIDNSTGVHEGGGEYSEHRFRFERIPGREFDDIVERVKTLSWKKYKRVVSRKEKRFVFRDGRYASLPERAKGQ